LKITNRYIHDITVVELDGKMTIGGGDSQLRQAIAELVANGRTRIVLDFSKVTKIDSSGLGELVTSYTRLSQIGGKLTFAALPPDLEGIFKVTQLISVFEMYPSASEAVSALQDRS
jgi:anti-anti-sigma factor